MMPDATNVSNTTNCDRGAWGLILEAKRGYEIAQWRNIVPVRRTNDIFVRDRQRDESWFW